MYMYIFHYFNYYLPAFVTAICLGSSLASRFWIFVFLSLNALTNHLLNLCSWPEIKPWASGVAALTPRPWTTRELALWECTQRKPLEYKTRHHPTTSSTLCRMPQLKNKQNKNTKPIIRRQEYHFTQPWPSEGRQTNKNAAQISPYTKLTWTTGSTIRGQKPKGRKNSTFFKEKKINFPWSLGKGDIKHNNLKKKNEKAEKYCTNEGTN